MMGLRVKPSALKEIVKEIDADGSGAIDYKELASFMKKFAEMQPGIGINDFAVSQTRPVSALRRGSHKLLYFYEDDRQELYNLQVDPGETRDLSGTFPEKAATLKKDLHQYLKQVGARMPKQVIVRP